LRIEKIEREEGENVKRVVDVQIFACMRERKREDRTRSMLVRPCASAYREGGGGWQKEGEECSIPRKEHPLIPISCRNASGVE